MPSLSDVADQQRRVYDAFPVHEVTPVIHTLARMPEDANDALVLAFAQSYRSQILGAKYRSWWKPEPDQYGFVYGLVDGVDLGGLAEEVSRYPAPSGTLLAAMGSTGNRVDGSSLLFLRNVAPHELGHISGLPHATTSAPHPDYPQYRGGLCGSAAEAGAYVPFNDFGKTFIYFNEDGDLVPTLGPVNDLDNLDDLLRGEIWGLIPRLWGDFQADDPKSIVSPYFVPPMMSYCFGQLQGSFVSGRNYTLLYNEFTGLVQAEATAKPGASTRPATTTSSSTPTARRSPPCRSRWRSPRSSRRSPARRRG